MVPHGQMSMRLSRREWIDAGLKAMARDWVDAVRIERLAAALKVTKGELLLALQGLRRAARIAA
jgi:hypothetical protein